METAPPLAAGHRLAAEARAAVAAARAGGEEVRARYGDTEAVRKAGGSPVTEADHASTAAILDVLRRAFPGDPILCEEMADGPERLGAERLWVVDPLDGTKEFLAMNGEFSVMIGLVEGGKPVLGVVLLPATGVLYAAAEGAGAWVERSGGLARLTTSPPPDGLRLVTSRSHADETVQALSAALPVVERRPSGSVGIKCALIAEGACDLYVHPVPYMGEWDTCAPEALLREAGGTVTDCSGAPLGYNKPDPRQPRGILACAPGVLERVLPVIRGLVNGSRT